MRKMRNGRRKKNHYRNETDAMEKGYGNDMYGSGDFDQMKTKVYCSVCHGECHTMNRHKQGPKRNPRACDTSRTAATKSCSLLTPASYIHHNSNTLVYHPLTSDAIWAWFSQTHKLNQCRVHQWKLQQEEYNKCTHEILSNNYYN
jgi:hypothetical protein